MKTQVQGLVSSHSSIEGGDMRIVFTESRSVEHHFTDESPVLPGWVPLEAAPHIAVGPFHFVSGQVEVYTTLENALLIGEEIAKAAKKGIEARMNEGRNPNGKLTEVPPPPTP